MRELLARVIRREDLSSDETARAFEQVMTSSADASAVAGLLVGLQVKGVTPGELEGAARVMRRHVVPLAVDGPVLDTCGTGGDASGTFNISTAAAIVAAGAGVRVVKHGNRAASSRSGSADVLEVLGVNLDTTPEVTAACVEAAGIGFCFARSHHPAMKHVAAVRQALGVPTIFNLLGPLTNPAGARRQLMGVYRPDLAPLMAEVLRRLGSERAWVVHADDGLDELSTSSPTHVVELAGGEVRTWRFEPQSLGIAPPPPGSLVVDGAAGSAEVIRGVLDGQAGPARDVVLLNAAAAVVVAGGADDLPAGLEVVAHAVDTGRAAATLDRLAEASHG